MYYNLMYIILVKMSNYVNVHHIRALREGDVIFGQRIMKPFMTQHFVLRLVNKSLSLSEPKMTKLCGLEM